MSTFKQTHESTENKAGRVVQICFCINGLFLKNGKYIGLIIRMTISKKEEKLKEIAATLGRNIIFNTMWDLTAGQRSCLSPEDNSQHEANGCSINQSQKGWGDISGQGTSRGAQTGTEEWQGAIFKSFLLQSVEWVVQPWLFFLF